MFVNLNVLNINPDMSIESRKLQSETRQTRIIFPGDLNDHDTLFGGNVLKWMDEVAYITAVRFCRQDMVTVSADRINFIQPVSAGTIAEFIGKVVEAGNVRIKVRVTVYAEQSDSDEKQKVIEGQFCFAAIDKDHKLIRLSIPGK